MIDRSFVLEGSRLKGALLIHGLTGAPGEMRYLAKKLHRAGFTVHVPQLAGHGADPETLLQTTWCDWLASVREAHRRLAERVEEVYVAGVCLGGALGVALAAECPTIKAAAVYSITFEYDGWSVPRWSVAAPWLHLSARIPFVRRIGIREAHPFGLKNERLRKRIVEAPHEFAEGALDYLPFGSLCQMYRLGRYVERVGPLVHQPTLILHAREDDMSSPRNAWRLQRALGSVAVVRLLDNSYHLIHVDQERDLVAQMTADFFHSAVVRDEEELIRVRAHG
jgi:carboxylesterase